MILRGQVSRDARNLKVRLASTAQAAMVFGFIWWRLGTAQSTIQSRLGLLQVRINLQCTWMVGHVCSGGVGCAPG